jgi:CPA2 family monovalent cation:H+ antiporter-2
MPQSVEDRLEEFISTLERDPLGAIDRFVAPDFFSYSPGPEEPTATERIGALVADLLVALPDFAASIIDVGRDGDRFTGSLRVTGTHANALWGAPGGGHRLDWTTRISLRAIDGRFAVRFDDFSAPEIVGVLRGLGLVNPPDEMDQPLHHPVAIPEFLLKLVFTGQASDRPCRHLASIRVTEPSTRVCAQCLARGDGWPALRMCLMCGFVGCCDTSKNRHALAHYEETGHPLVRSIRMDEGWGWCYEDNAFFESATIVRRA